MATDAAPEIKPAEGPRRPPPLARKLSEELQDLRARTAERAVTLREVIFVLRGRAYTLIVVLLALPFLVPVSLPGLSTPIGLAIGIIALRLSLGQRPWLPKKLQRKELPPGFFGQVFTLAGRIIRFLESFSRPRLAWVTASARMNQVHAVLMLVSAVVLLLPLPIPFSNTFPGWVIVLMAGGLMERDGVFVLASYVMFIAGTLYFVLLGEATRQLLEALKHWLLG
jgi:hypothetical protein